MVDLSGLRRLFQPAPGAVDDAQDSQPDAHIQRTTPGVSAGLPDTAPETADTIDDAHASFVAAEKRDLRLFEGLQRLAGIGKRTELLPELVGDWFAQVVEASQRRSKRSPSAMAVRVVQIGEAYEALHDGMVMWRVNRHVRAATSSGIPGWTAHMRTPDGNFEDRVLVMAEAPEVLFFVLGRQCVLRCWRQQSEPPASTNGRPGASAAAEPRTGRGGSRAGARKHSGGPKRPAPGAIDVESAAATIVATWAMDKDLPSMLESLASFTEIFGESPPPPLKRRGGHADPAHVRRAYLWACRALHPDRHVGASPRARALAAELFKAISGAHARARAQHEDETTAQK